MDAIAVAQFVFAPALASALLHSLWQDTLLALAAALVLSVLARRTATLRHTVAMVFLAAMVVAPALRFVGYWGQPATELNAGLLPVVATLKSMEISAPIVQESGAAAAVVAVLWLVGVVLMLLRHAGGLGFVRTMERSPFESLPPHWQQRVRELGRALGIARDVSVRLSREVVAPFAVRVLRPVVWLPMSLLTRLPAEQLEALLAHELAHIARKDWLWNGLQCVLEALLFFHPAVWWLGRRIRQEREHACDDLAVAACGDAIALAEALVTLERTRHSFPRLVLAAQGGSLMQRITRLLSNPPTRGGWGARIVLGVVLIGGALLVSQVGLAGNWRPDLHISSTTDGPMGPNDVREITAHGIDGDRYYRASIDAQGKLTEIYEKDGKAQPVDAEVRQWVAGVMRLTAPPAPPAPPAAPAPPLASAIPLPPLPPIPRIEDAVQFKALAKVVAANPQVVARIGTPVVVRSDESGHITLDDDDGRADTGLILSGPAGNASVRIKAELADGVWTLERLTFQ